MNKKMPMEMDESVHKMECVGNEIWQREEAIKNFDCVINENMRWFNWPRKKVLGKKWSIFMCAGYGSNTPVSMDHGQTVFFISLDYDLCAAAFCSLCRIALRKCVRVLSRLRSIMTQNAKTSHALFDVWSLFGCVCVWMVIIRFVESVHVNNTINSSHKA